MIFASRSSVLRGLAATLLLLGFGCANGTGVSLPDGGGDRPAADAAPGDADADAPVEGLGCSADLRSILDGSGAVLATCAVDEGCLGGRCVAACAAAEGSRGNVGCDFLVPTPPTWSAVLPPCFAVFVTNTWPRPAHLTVTRDGVSFDATTFARVPTTGTDATAWPALPASGLAVDQVAVLFLSSDPDSVLGETGEPLRCPLTPAVNGSTAVAAVGVGRAFRVVSDTPVSAYDILPYGGAPSHIPSAELLLPVSAWGRDYVVIDAPPGTHTEPGPLWLQVLARHDDTTVRLRPTVDLPGGDNAPAAPAGTTTTTILAAGQYAQWQLPAGTLDLSGTLVHAEQDVAVFAGNRFLRLQPTPGPGGDATHQQLIPVTALGHEYVAAPYATRRADLQPEVISYRLVGAFDGTILTYDPAVAGAPGTLDRGQVADLQTSLAFRVSSQDDSHPFAAAQLMTTANLEGGSRPGATDPHYPPMLGDEELVVMFPPAQFLSRYVFFTDPTYPTTSLVLTRVKPASAEFQMLVVDCLGEVGGWQPVGTDGRYEVTTVDLLRAGVGPCQNGRHVASSSAPFGLVVWGEDAYSSYAYPAGGNAATLKELPPLL
jgi:hypothetical protein